MLLKQLLLVKKFCYITYVKINNEGKYAVHDTMIKFAVFGRLSCKTTTLDLKSLQKYKKLNYFSNFLVLCLLVILICHKHHNTGEKNQLTSLKTSIKSYSWIKFAPTVCAT
jgi:hypothetical protein